MTAVFSEKRRSQTVLELDKRKSYLMSEPESKQRPLRKVIAVLFFCAVNFTESGYCLPSHSQGPLPHQQLKPGRA